MIRNLRCVILVVTITTAFLAVLQSAGSGGSVGGVVKNRSGEPVVGAFVRVKNTDRRFSVTVISRERGRYNVSDLSPGTYTVESVGGGEQSENATVEIDSNRSPTVNLMLNAPAPFKGNVPIAEMAALMPEGEAKTIIVGDCTHCHLNGLEEILVLRKSREGWEEIIAKMENHPFGSGNSLVLDPKKRDVVIDYLARNFGPDAAPFDPNKLPKEWVRGAAAKSIVTEYFLPAGVRPHDMTVDSKGICWVAESTSGILGRYDPQTATYTRIRLPGEKPWPEPIAVDPKDHLWMADSHGATNRRFIEYDPETGTFTTYPIPKPRLGFGHGIFNYGIITIRFHPDGTVWAGIHGAKTIVRLNPATKEVTEYDVPAADTLYGMAIDGSKAVWFAEQFPGRMGRIDSQTGQLTEFELPTKDSMPQKMATDAEGNIWVAEYRVAKLAKIDYRTTKITEYPTPTKNSGPYSVVVDKARNVIWVNEMMAGQFARFDPHTKTFVEYPIPTRLSSARIIELDPTRPNRIWFSGLFRDNVGYMDIIE